MYAESKILIASVVGPSFVSVFSSTQAEYGGSYSFLHCTISLTRADMIVY